MNILVINGSPKGKYSITIQTINYLEKIFNEHKFTILDVAQKIHTINIDYESFKQSDIILFSYPVYTFIAPSQLHHFIRMMKESNLDFSNMVASQITTSKHFYDVSAHKYIIENCHDMGINFIQGLSLDMDDLLKESGQKQIVDYFKMLIFSYENKIFEKPRLRTSKSLIQSVSIAQSVEKKDTKNVVILKDSTNTNNTLENMIISFQNLLPYQSKVIDIGSYPFKGGCLGCFACASNGKCIYKDNFDTFLRNEIQNTSSIITAFNIQDHSMGERFKLYDDRQFCNGHRTVTSTLPIGYLITGPYDEEDNLRMIIEARAQVGGNYLSGIATNQTNPESEIAELVKKLTYALENNIVPEKNFFAIGGMKIFRDLIYLMGGMMKADYKYYKEHKLFDDFPQRDRKTKFKMKLVGLFINNPKLVAKAKNAINEGMVAPYKKVIQNIDTKK